MSYWLHRLTNGSEIAVRRIDNGRGKFIELFTGAENVLAKVSQECELAFLEISNSDQVSQEFDSSLEFRVSASTEFFLEAYRELRILKDNFLKMNVSVAYEFDNCEVTAQHPCGGTIGEFLY